MSSPARMKDNSDDIIIIPPPPPPSPVPVGENDLDVTVLYSTLFPENQEEEDEEVASQ